MWSARVGDLTAKNAEDAETIAGKPLADGCHFGQTIINNHGRPYGEGANFPSRRAHSSLRSPSCSMKRAVLASTSQASCVMALASWLTTPFWLGSNSAYLRH